MMALSGYAPYKAPLVWHWMTPIGDGLSCVDSDDC